MKLVDCEIAIGHIALDANNPRFMTKPGDTQDQIKNRMLGTKDAKTLLNSMKVEIRWVNRIVVRKVNDSDCPYVVVEGNTRLACLKSNDMQQKGYTDQTIIPVLEAVREEDETNEEYEESLRITQGIANVMVVKQWPAVSKARHLYTMFWTKRINHSGETEAKTIKDIADSLGTSVKEVRDAVKRYAFYNEIAKEADTLDDEQWSFLEGIDKNAVTRGFFGFNDRTYKFAWEDSEDITDEDQIKKDRLNNIPQLIRRESITAKEFRDRFPKLVTDINDEVNFYELLNGDISWANVGNMSATPKEDWVNKLGSVHTILSEFPNGADWAADQDIKEILKGIKNKANRQLTILESLND